MSRRYDPKTYYAEKKDKINRRRRERYRILPEHRKHVKAQSRDSYRRAALKSGKVDRRTISANGDNLFAIGILSETIKKSVQTIRGYHRAGVLPQVLYTDSRGWRLYTSSQMESMRQAFGKFAKGELLALKDVQIYLEERWEDGESEGDK